MKLDYFKNLEELSSLSALAVRAACEKRDESTVNIRKECDRLLCTTEDALFSDFMPPLERDDIAALAHCLCRVTDLACELSAEPSATISFMSKNQEAVVCVKLADELKKAIFRLRCIKRPSSGIPDLCLYRNLICEGRHAHSVMLTSVRKGRIPKTHAEAIILTGRLRSELSYAFDELIEITLNNI